MERSPAKDISRRQFLTLSVYGAASLSITGLIGCATLPRPPIPDMSYDMGVLLKNCNIVDVISGQLLERKNLILRNGRIESVMDSVIDTHVKPQNIGIEIDIKHKYIIPGLIDAHCHTTLPGSADFGLLDGATLFNQIKRNYVQQLYNGVTTIRDVGAMPKQLHAHLNQIKEGDLPGPRVIYCNAFTNIKDSHPDIDPSDVSIFAKPVQIFAGDQNLYFTDLEDLKSKMDENVKGAGFIKLTMDNLSLLCGKGKIPVYKAEHLNYILDYGQKHELPVIGHIHRKWGFNRGLSYGIDSMEHSIEELLSDNEIEQMVKKNIAIVPTLDIAQIFAEERVYKEIPAEYRNDFVDGEMKVRREYLNSYHDRYIHRSIHDLNIDILSDYTKYACEEMNARKIFLPQPDLYFRILKNGSQNLLKMKQAGVLIGCGTDAGVPLVYHGHLWREMEICNRLGFSPIDIIQCATINNAKILRQQDHIGSIETGKYADLVVLKDNPMQDITTLRNPSAVFKNGELVYLENQLKQTYSIASVG